MATIRLEGVDYCEVSDAARVLKVTPGRVRHFLDAGRLPGAIKIGPTRLIPVQALEDFAKIPRKVGNPLFGNPKCED